MSIFKNLSSMKILTTLSLIILPFLIFSQEKEIKLIPTQDIEIRDPYIYADSISQNYYMYKNIGNSLGEKGVEVFVSSDLKEWKQPQTVLLLPDDFWARKMVWAPEMHEYNGKYYLFVTLTSSELHEHMKKPEGETNWPPFYKRGTQIFVADSPMGPFKAFDNKPHTPENWMALDGTLYIEDDIPYMIFCREWVEIVDGSMEYVQLSPDLSKPVGNPVTMFHASDAEWSTNKNSKVTDGCFMHKTKSGKLLMIWSSFGEEGYAIGIAESESGKLKGPWIQQDDLLFEQNGGHGMIFKTFDNKLYLALHQPNNPSGQERLILTEIEDTGDTLIVK